MNHIESAVTRAATELAPLEAIQGFSPVLTPVLVAATAGLLVGGAVGCAEGHCAQDPGNEAVHFTGEIAGMSVGDLLQARHDAL